MSSPTTPSYETRKQPRQNDALKRCSSLTVWFDHVTTWEAVPTSKRGKLLGVSGYAIQTCVAMKMLFGRALRQTKGFVESVLLLVGLNWAVAGFITLRRGRVG